MYFSCSCQDIHHQMHAIILHFAAKMHWDDLNSCPFSQSDEAARVWETVLCMKKSFPYNVLFMAFFLPGRDNTHTLNQSLKCGVRGESQTPPCITSQHWHLLATSALRLRLVPPFSSAAEHLLLNQMSYWPCFVQYSTEGLLHPSLLIDCKFTFMVVSRVSLQLLWNETYHFTSFLKQKSDPHVGNSPMIPSTSCINKNCHSTDTILKCQLWGRLHGHVYRHKSWPPYKSVLPFTLLTSLSSLTLLFNPLFLTSTVFFSCLWPYTPFSSSTHRP